MTSRQRLSDNSVLQLTLGVHLALLAGVHRYWNSGAPISNRFADFQLAVSGGVFLGQVALVGAWAAFGRSRLVLRCAALVLFVPLLSAVQSHVFCHSGALLWWLGYSHDSWMRSTIWIEELSLFAMGIALSGSGLSCAGCRVEVPGSVPLRTTLIPRFRMFDLLCWFVLLGALLGAGRWLVEYGWTWRRGMVAAESVLESAWDTRLEFAGLTLFIAAAVLGLNSFRWTLGALTLAPLAFSVLDKLWGRPWLYGAGETIDGGYRSLSDDYVALVYCIFIAIFGGTLRVLRDRGYRLTCRRPWR